MIFKKFYTRNAADVVCYWPPDWIHTFIWFIITQYYVLISLQDLSGNESKQDREVCGFPTRKPMSCWKVVVKPINHSGKVIPLVAAIYSREVNYFFFWITPIIYFYNKLHFHNWSASLISFSYNALTGFFSGLTTRERRLLLECSVMKY